VATRRPHLSLQARLFLLTAVALAPALAILAYNEVALRHARELEAHDLTLRFGQLAAQDLEGIVAGVEGLLRAVARAPVVRSFDATPCGAYLSDVQAQSTNLTALTVLDLDGRIRCSPGSPVSDASFSDRQYFREAVAAGRFVVGEYTVGRVSGRRGLPVAAPVRNEDGSVAGVVAAGLDLEWLGQRLRSRDYTRGRALTIADRNGVIVAREPLPDRFIGTRIPEPYMGLVRASSPGSLKVLSQDGTPRIIGYVPPAANGAGLYISAGLSREEVFAPIDRATGRGAALTAAGALSAFILAWLLGRRVIGMPVERVLRTIGAWRAGNHGARTGLAAERGELEALGAAVDGLMDEITAHQEHQALLVNELNHRVKNTLATVQSIAARTFHGGGATSEARAAFEARLTALSKAQDVLTRKNWEGARLEEIVREAVEPHCADERARLALKGPAVQLPPRMAMALAMALHELCTNAAKYGAFSTREGQVAVEWLVVFEGERPRLRLTWRERGGPPVRLPARRGFGSRLIERGLAGELGGEVHLRFEPDGVVCMLDAPIPTTRPGAHWTSAA
jgi:two-component sensor histidine kinase